MLPPPPNQATLLPRSLRLGACERIILKLKKKLTCLQMSIWLLCVMLATGKLEFIK